MTRFEKMKESDISDMKKILCDYIAVQTEDACARCPFDDRCYPGHNGITDFLEEDYADGKVIDKWGVR